MGLIVVSCWQVSSRAFLLFCNQINTTGPKSKMCFLEFGTASTITTPCCMLQSSTQTGLHLSVEATKHRAVGMSSAEMSTPTGSFQHTSPDLRNQHHKLNHFWTEEKTHPRGEPGFSCQRQLWLFVVICSRFLPSGMHSARGPNPVNICGPLRLPKELVWFSQTLQVASVEHHTCQPRIPDSYQVRPSAF